MRACAPFAAFFASVLAVAACALAIVACNGAEPPARFEVLRLSGTPRERGLQHGRALSSKIKSFYTTMLSTSLLPYLNREQKTIASVLSVYSSPEYANGQFSVRLLRESARSLEGYLLPAEKEELQGIAEGAGVPYDDVLVLNTFLDTTLAARSITYFLHSVQAPRLERIEFVAPALLTDAVDNDGDGKTDEANEGAIDHAPSATATYLEVPVDATLRLRLSDDDGIAPASVRLRINGVVVGAGDPGLHVAPLQYATSASTTVFIAEYKPGQPWPKAAVVSVAVQASDARVVAEPPPAHARAMRVEQFTFTTAGAGKKLHEVENRGLADGTSQPPSLAFALRGTATADGHALLAHHFSLLDAGTSHKHAVVQFHTPKDGQPFAFVGWAGIAYGLSGINARGVAVSVNFSDTLNNPLVGEFLREFNNAKLMSKGVPGGFCVRRALEAAAHADAATEILAALPHSFGWNFLVADAAGTLRAVEAHTNVLGDGATKPAVFGPDFGLGPGFQGWPRASTGPDDLRVGTYFRQRADDLDVAFGWELRPQRFWSSYFHPSVRAMASLGDAIAGRKGPFHVAGVAALLRTPALVDRNDSMFATIAEPKFRRLHVAAGSVPATDGSFEAFTLPIEGPP